MYVHVHVGMYIVPTYMYNKTFINSYLKGIVQRKLRWVESGVNRWVVLQYWGAGHYFLILKRHHLQFRIKRFAATSALRYFACLLYFTNWR
jgi:hypothetical protein